MEPWYGKAYGKSHPLSLALVSRSLPVLDALLAHPWPGVCATPSTTWNPPTPWGEAAKVGWKEGWDRLIAVLGPHAPWAPPLHAAVLARRPDWVAQVLATGAAVEQRNRARRTPLGAMATLMKNVRHMSGVEGDRKSTTPPA